MPKEIIEYSNYAEYLRLMEHRAQERKALQKRPVPEPRTAKAPKVAEAQIQKEILTYLKSKGIFHWRQNTQGQLMHGQGSSFMKESSAPGAPDILGVLPDGRALLIEVKASDWVPPSPETVERATIEHDRGDTKTDRYKTFRAQREFQSRGFKNSALVIVATSLEHVRSRIEGYLGALDAHLPPLDPGFSRTLDDVYRDAERKRSNRNCRGNPG